jgi:hypothetical protein
MYLGRACNIIEGSGWRDGEKVTNAGDYDSPSLWNSSETPYM